MIRAAPKRWTAGPGCSPAHGRRSVFRRPPGRDTRRSFTCLLSDLIRKRTAAVSSGWSRLFASSVDGSVPVTTGARRLAMCPSKIAFEPPVQQGFVHMSS